MSPDVSPNPVAAQACWYGETGNESLYPQGEHSRRLNTRDVAKMRGMLEGRRTSDG
jgi:hypothetical protein